MCGQCERSGLAEDDFSRTQLAKAAEERAALALWAEHHPRERFLQLCDQRRAILERMSEQKKMQAASAGPQCHNGLYTLGFAQKVALWVRNGKKKLWWWYTDSCYMCKAEQAAGLHQGTLLAACSLCSTRWHVARCVVYDCAMHLVLLAPRLRGPFFSSPQPAVS